MLGRGGAGRIGWEGQLGRSPSASCGSASCGVPRRVCLARQVPPREIRQVWAKARAQAPTGGVLSARRPPPVQLPNRVGADAIVGTRHPYVPRRRGEGALTSARQPRNRDGVKWPPLGVATWATPAAAPATVRARRARRPRGDAAQGRRRASAGVRRAAAGRRGRLGDGAGLVDPRACRVCSVGKQGRRSGYQTCLRWSIPCRGRAASHGACDGARAPLFLVNDATVLDYVSWLRLWNLTFDVIPRSN